MISVWFFILILIALNGFYVTAEFGTVSVRRSKIRQLAEGGQPLALRLLPVLDDPVKLDRYIAACQIGITWSSLVLGAYSQSFLTPGLIPYLLDWGLSESTATSTATGVVLVLMTIFQVVGGELVPKSLALQYPTQAALYTLPPMKLSVAAYSWFLKILNGSGLAILRLMGFTQVGHGHIHSPEEIELLIAESREGGLLEPEEHERLHRALRLVSRPVRQLMIPRSHVVSISVDANPEELTARLKASRYTRFPVHEGPSDNIIGLIHTKDVVAYLVEHGQIPSVRKVMRAVLSIPETVTADRLFAMFRERRTHQASVVDEHGLVGLVTLGDLISELLGERSHEFKGGQPKPVRLPDGRVRLPGLLRIDELEAWTGLQLESPADTLGGHVMHVLGRVPAAGDRLEIDGAGIEIETVSANTISSVLVTPVSAPVEVENG